MEKNSGVTVDAEKAPQPELPLYNKVYTIQIHPNYTPNGIVQANEELASLKKVGLDCRLERWVEAEGEPQFRIFCGQSTTLAGLEETVKAAHNNHIDFIVVLTQYSSDLPISLSNVEQEKLHTQIHEQDERDVAKAFTLLNNGKTEEAEMIFSEVIKRDPGNINGQYGLAIVEAKRRNWSKAYEIIEPLLEWTDRQDIHETADMILFNRDLDLGWALSKSAPEKALLAFNRARTVYDSVDVWKGLAHTYYNMGQLEKALPLFQKVYAKQPDWQTADMIVITMERLGLYDEASSFYQSLPPEVKSKISLNPQRRYNLERIEKFMRAGKLDDAEKLIDEMYKQDSEDVDVLLYYGWLYLEKKEPAKAESFYRKALSWDADNTYALRGIAGALLAQQKEEEALFYLEKIDPKKIDITEDVDKAYLSIYRRQDDLNKALEIAQKIIARNPKDSKGYLLLGDLYTERGDYKNAFYYYSKAEKLDPNNFKVKMRILRFFLKKKRFDQIQVILETLRNQPLTAEEFNELKDFYYLYYIHYCSLLLDRKEFVKALKYASHGLKLFPDDTGFMSQIAWAAYNLDEADKAVKYFKSALKKEKKQIDLWYGLGLSYQKQGNIDDAMKALKKAEESENADILYHIADIYRLNGFPDDAERVATKADGIITVK